MLFYLSNALNAKAPSLVVVQVGAKTLADSKPTAPPTDDRRINPTTDRSTDGQTDRLANIDNNFLNHKLRREEVGLHGQECVGKMLPAREEDSGRLGTHLHKL